MTDQELPEVVAEICGLKVGVGPMLYDYHCSYSYYGADNTTELIHRAGK